MRRNDFSREEMLQKVKETLEAALATEEAVPLSTVAKHLRCDTTSLRVYFPDLSRAVVLRYRERIATSNFKERLEEIVASNEEYPSLEEVALQLEVTSSFLRWRFPALCNE